MTVFEKLAESEKPIAELEEENKRLHNTVAYLTNKRFDRSTCRQNEKSYINKASTPAPVILHSMASSSTIAWVIHQKFINAILLYRQEKEWQMLGIDLERETMANWILASVRDWLMPMVEILHQLLPESWAPASKS